MEQICPERLCTACAACYNVCPKQAISMAEVGAIGYLYPRIDADRCIDCGLCQKVCPVVNPVPKHEPLQTFAAIDRNVEALGKSASGGAASAMAKVVIEQGGVVYGCCMRSYTDIAHSRFTTLEEMYAMRGSKYVQSLIGLIYKDVKKDLEAGYTVLFTGTACQIGGLRNYLHKDYNRLYCLDLVCHGVPSQKLLRDNIENMFRKKGLSPKGTERVEFRRICSDQTSNLDLRFGTFVESAIPIGWQKFLNNTYITAFMYGLTFRDNCYECPYACTKRVADITVADFWGYRGNQIPQGLGVSLVMPSTAKGLQLVEQVRPFMLMEERPISEAVNGNGQLLHPSVRPTEREIFVAEYENSGEKLITSLLRKYKRQYRKNAIINKGIRIIAKYPKLYLCIRNIYHRL